MFILGARPAPLVHLIKKWCFKLSSSAPASDHVNYHEQFFRTASCFWSFKVEACFLFVCFFISVKCVSWMFVSDQNLLSEWPIQSPWWPIDFWSKGSNGPMAFFPIMSTAECFHFMRQRILGMQKDQHRKLNSVQMFLSCRMCRFLESLCIL